MVTTRLIAVIAVLTALGAPYSWAEERSIDFRPFFDALESGKSDLALSLGDKIYLRAALEAAGEDEALVFRVGLILTQCRHAARNVREELESLYKPVPGEAFSGQVNWLWFHYEYVCKETAGLKFPDSEMGRFLKAYLTARLDHWIGSVLDVIPADASHVSDEQAATTAPYLAVIPAIAIHAVDADVPNLTRTVRWLVRSGQFGGAIEFSLHESRQRSLAAAALAKLALAQDPGNVELRRQFVSVLTGLRDAKESRRASELCLWAQETVADPGFSDVLVLKQAVIAGRDQKNYALAIRLCDSVSGPGRAPEKSVMARYLSGAFCLAKGDYSETISRMEALLADEATSQDYRVRAASLIANAWSRLGKPGKSVSVLQGFLGGLSQPEPGGAAECRKALYTALLSLQRYDEAAEECRRLVSLHPGHEAAKSAQQVLSQLERRTPAADAGK